AKNCYKFNRSQTFRNIFDSCIHEDAAAIKVEYIAQKLIPIKHLCFGKTLRILMQSLI
ncbi:hypothetical protein RhiirA5_347175, partial [Rhizophagus irregularis]